MILVGNSDGDGDDDDDAAADAQGPIQLLVYLPGRQS